MHHTYIPHGVCSRQYSFDLKDGKIYNLSIAGGCNGNLSGISRLLEGMDAKEAITRMKGTRCGLKSTSCPDQISIALEDALKVESSDNA